MTNIGTYDLAAAIIAGYELGQEIGSLDALGSLDDVLGFVGGEHEDHAQSAFTQTISPDIDPDIVYLDNLGDRVLKLEQILAENGTYVGGCGCTCKGL